ncbi:UPF0182 family membrane protein [Auraticoccus monumenti]|uniref:UPF0182 protein SAMN04489747_2684 n=1 Tax=Auraticoccus monumenti TaxID=675864 RepID=A0A1G7AP16_9ACTN|nr:UPF0182 family protein [Auraticoccus monumenti]SDE16513.1 hypothetical protein SAMN04489747_2684 [Auraticoccus monumenti]
MSSTTVRPAQPRRGALLPTLAVLGALVVAFTLFSGIWTDRLWYSSIGYESVFATQLFTRVGLFVVFGLVMALVVVGNIALAYRLRPRYRATAPASELLERSRDVLESRLVRILVVLGVVVGLFGGASAAGASSTYLAWRNATPFGINDPLFGLDISFFVFDYPWWRLVTSFLLVAVVLGAIGASVVHYLLGALRYSPGRQLTSRAAQVHLSVILGVALLIYAVQQYLDRYGFELTAKSLSNATMTALNYTDENARVIGRLILAVIAVICAVVFFINAAVQRWAFPVVAVAMMVLSGLILAVAYPLGLQVITVNPNEPDLERPYIEQHIGATRAAFGVEDVEIEDYDADTVAEAGQLRADAEALPGIRLIDPAIIDGAYEQLQQVRGYYQFPELLDVDRYTIDGQETDAVVAAREMNHDGVDNQSWNNLKTVYTHGYGLVAAYGNRAVGGEPDWILRDIPPVGELEVPEPRIYFGESLTDYSIVGAPAGAPPVELDTPGGGENGRERLTTYDGEGGVEIGSLFNRALYAIRNTDVNILLSERVNSESKIIYNRTPRQRVQAAAPWLTVDSNSYPALVEGRIVWIVDAYTTSDSYPNSQRVDLEDATSDSLSQLGVVSALPSQTVNYMRNSVKAVVDAYDGSVTLYGWDEDDPVLQTWQKAFPGTVQPKSAISADLMDHLRYPEDLYKVQREILARYHVTDPAAWYQGTDLWRIPEDPVQGGGTQKETPYYLSIKWPGDDEPVFSQTAVYVPNERSNLAAYMAVNADAASPDYGRLRILRMSDTQQIAGPGQTFNEMNTNVTVAERLRPFNNQGSAQLQYGNLLTLPIGGGLLYVAPIYTERPGSNGSYPALSFVVARFGETVGIGTTLQEALDAVFDGDSGATTDEEGVGGAEPGADPQEPTGEVDNPAAAAALDAAAQAFEDADAALRDGDLATYQQKNDEARARMEDALTALGR